MDIQNRISELITLQQIEKEAGFPNDDLWNELDDIIWRLENYGQEEPLEDILNEEGWVVGVRYRDGREVWYEGMTFENQY
jgi:hypothetical protein